MNDESSNFLKDIVVVLVNLGVSNWLIAIMIILFVAIIIISITWNKGLDTFCIWAFDIFTNKEKREQNEKLERELSEFLLKEKEGKNEGLLKLEEKFDDRIDEMGKDIKGLKTSLDKTMRDVQTYALSKETIQKIFSNDSLKKTEMIQIDLIDVYYEMFEETIFKFLNEDSNKLTIVYETLNTIKQDFIQISEKAYQNAELNIKLQGLILDANEPIYRQMNEYHEQLTDIIDNTQNGFRNKMIKKHLQMCKYAERDLFSKEFWRLAKQKFDL